MTQARFPAEWEPQSGVILAWPHAGTDWAPRLAEVERAYVGLVAAVSRFEPVLLCVADAEVEARARAMLEGRVDPARLRCARLPYDDTWLRDSGPITLRDGAGFRLLDFRQARSPVRAGVRPGQDHARLGLPLGGEAAFHRHPLAQGVAGAGPISSSLALASTALTTCEFSK